MKDFRAVRSAPGRVEPVGPYSQAVVAGGWVVTAGQVPLEPDGSCPVDFADQVRVTLKNLSAVLREAGTDLEHVVKVNAYLADPDTLSTYNEVYADVFGTAVPARTSVAVGLWGVGLEVECWAVLPDAPLPALDSEPAAFNSSSTPALTVADLDGIDLPTLGHLLDIGFMDSSMRWIGGGSPEDPIGGDSVRMAGPARTALIVGHDAYAVNRAVRAVRPGEVLVLDMVGDRWHAPLGAVTIAALAAAGCVGAVVDGVVTDLPALRHGEVPVFARGTSCLTTKRKAHPGSRLDVPVDCGGARIRPGELVAGDRNGVAVLGPMNPKMAEILALARAADEAEPALLERIRRGDDLAELLPGRPPSEA